MLTALLGHRDCCRSQTKRSVLSKWKEWRWVYLLDNEDEGVSVRNQSKFDILYDELVKDRNGTILQTIDLVSSRNVEREIGLRHLYRSSVFPTGCGEEGPGVVACFSPVGNCASFSFLPTRSATMLPYLQGVGCEAEELSDIEFGMSAAGLVLSKLVELGSPECPENGRFVLIFWDHGLTRCCSYKVIDIMGVDRGLIGIEETVALIKSLHEGCHFDERFGV